MGPSLQARGGEAHLHLPPWAKQLCELTWMTPPEAWALKTQPLSPLLSLSDSCPSRRSLPLTALDLGSNFPKEAGGP